MRLNLLLGAALIFVGLAVTFNLIPMATIIYPRLIWYSVFPGGTSGNPTVLTPGSTITLKADMVFADTQMGVVLPAVDHWDVSVTVEGAAVKLVPTGASWHAAGTYQIRTCQASWTVPSAEGKTLKFDWKAVIKDSAGKVLGTATLTTYGRTGSSAAGEPDGYFTVNGIRVDATSTIIVTSATLSVAFTPTRNAAAITRVLVECYKDGKLIGSTTLPFQSGTMNYMGSYTLPEYGTYELKGVIEWGGGKLNKMNIVVSWGEEALAPGIPLLQIIGVCMMAAGVWIAMRKKPLF